jgi:hypothetical protein
MTSLVLGIEQIVGLVQILDEHKQPVSVVARVQICKRLMSPRIDSASLFSLSTNLETFRPAFVAWRAGE